MFHLEGKKGQCVALTDARGCFAASSEISDLVERGQMMMSMQEIFMDFSSGSCG